MMNYREIIKYINDNEECDINYTISLLKVALSYGNHKHQCTYNYGHDCSCGFDELKKIAGMRS